MKNMIEVPSEKDFYRTKNIELTNEHNGLQKIHYRECNIAMRSITDFTSIENEVEIIDEEKFPEFEKEVEDYKMKIRRSENGEMVGFGRPPEPPTKKVKITGTIISYFNGTGRIIIDNFEDFEEKYFNYLTEQRLDILKS